MVQTWNMNHGGICRTKFNHDGVILQKWSTTFTQPAITCSKLIIESLEQGVKYVQSSQ